MVLDMSTREFRYPRCGKKEIRSSRTFENSIEALAKQEKECRGFRCGARSIKVSNQHLRKEVEDVETSNRESESSEYRTQHEFGFDFSKQHDLKKTITQLKVVTPTRSRRRRSFITAQTPTRLSSPSRRRVRREKKEVVVSCSTYAASQIMPGHLRKNRVHKDVVTKTKPFVFIFEQSCRFESMQKKDWMKCMRAMSIVPRLISIQTAVLIFEQYSVGSVMPRPDFLRAVTRIARVLYTEQNSADLSLKKLSRHILEFGLEGWSRHARGVLSRYLR